jgi:hypothetical protein
MDCIDDKLYEAACNELMEIYELREYTMGLDEIVELRHKVICKIIIKYGILSKPFKNKNPLDGYCTRYNTCMYDMCIDEMTSVKYIDVFGLLWKLTDRLNNISILFKNSSSRYGVINQYYRLYHIKIKKLILIYGKY